MDHIIFLHAHQQQRPLQWVLEGKSGRVRALGGRDFFSASGGGREGGKEDGVDDGGELAVGLALEDPDEVVACGGREVGR